MPMGKSNNGVHGKMDQAILRVLIGLFVVPIFVREMMFSNFHQINIFAALGCLFVFHVMLKGGKLRRKDFVPYLIIVCLIVILALSEVHAGRTLKGFVRVFFGLIMPLPLLFYEMYNPRETIRIIVCTFRTVSFLIVCLGIVDLILGRRVIVSYFNLAYDANYANMVLGSIRLYSYIGHPLYNAELFLMTFGLSYIYGELSEKNHKQDKWVILITAIGVALTALKPTIVIFLVLLIVLYVKNIRYIVFILVILAIGYFYGVFDFVLQCLSGSLITGRAEAWSRINSRGIKLFHFFRGNGSDSKYSYAYLGEWARAAFEYPYRLYALEFGILLTILIFVFLFVIPRVRIIKNCTRWILFSIVFLAVVAHVNTYDGIGAYSDPMYLYCLFGCTMLSMSMLLKKENLDK